MTVGTPGAGIGGLFYLASAIVLPVRALLRQMKGERVAWGGVARQWTLAVGVLAAIWLAGWLIGLWAGPTPMVAGRGMAGAMLRSTGVLATAMLYASIGTLILVLLLVQAAIRLVRRSPLPAAASQARLLSGGPEIGPVRPVPASAEGSHDQRR